MAKACAKIILTGEHAVVYGKAGIALPVHEYFTEVKVKKAESFSFNVNADVKLDFYRKIFDKLFKVMGVSDRLHIKINFEMPMYAGLGSSASLAVALARSLSEFYKLNLNTQKINSIAFEIEKIFHGTPSGIDNSVIAYEKSVLYEEKKIKFLDFKHNFSFVIADTGIRGSTKDSVAGVRKRYERDKEKYRKLFDEIGYITENVKKALESGNVKLLGELMTQNHKLLQEIGVSCKELDNLVNIAVEAGAYGAKMSGGGLGGNIIALGDETVCKALEKDAEKVIISKIFPL